MRISQEHAARRAHRTQLRYGMVHELHADPLPLPLRQDRQRPQAEPIRRANGEPYRRDRHMADHRSIVVSHQRQRELPRMTQRVHNEVLSVAGVLGIMERRYRDGLDGRYIGCCFVADLEGHGVSIVC